MQNFSFSRERLRAQSLLKKGTWAQSNVRGGMRKNTQFFQESEEKSLLEDLTIGHTSLEGEGSEAEVGGFAHFGSEKEILWAVAEWQVVQIRSDVVN